MTKRQFEIAQKAATTPMVNKELAAFFGISVSTVRFHLNKVYRQLRQSPGSGNQRLRLAQAFLAPSFKNWPTYERYRRHRCQTS